MLESLWKDIFSKRLGIATRPSAIMKELVEILGLSHKKRICVTQKLIMES